MRELVQNAGGNDGDRNSLIKWNIFLLMQNSTKRVSTAVKEIAAWNECNSVVPDFAKRYEKSKTR